MTDGSDGSGQMPRRTTRVGDGGAPVTGALAIVLAVVAVLAGFLILRSISDGGEQSLDFGTTGSDSAVDPADSATDTVNTSTGDTVATLPPVTTEPPLITVGASVVVANANGIGGSASAMSRALETGPGFVMVDPVNSSATINDLDVSVIYFVPTNPAAEDVANSLATVVGGVATIAPMPDVPPTRDGTLNGAEVLLMLGNDKAGKTLAELAPTTTAVATAVTNPPIAGATTTVPG
jgi:hypothetical protein